MKNNRKTCYAHRIRLEKLKQKTWLFSVFARVLFFLVNLVDHYLRQS
ncbi:hypothetical protein WDW86_13440 [Bdellovibrionota bacterium FG-2]